MDELKRISRYILPGITVSFVLISFLLLTTEIYEDYINSVFKNSELFISILAIIFSSGALGFIFSIIYYPITQVIFPFFAVDHTIIFKECSDKIEIFKKTNPKEVINPMLMNKRDAWILANQLWHKNSNYCSIKNYMEMGGRLANIFQGVGTTLIGFIIAFIFWFIIFLKQSNFNWCCLVSSLICWSAIIGFTTVNYFMNKKALGVNQNAILIEFIINKWEENKNQIIKLYFPL